MIRGGIEIEFLILFWRSYRDCAVLPSFSSIEFEKSSNLASLLCPQPSKSHKFRWTTSPSSPFLLNSTKSHPNLLKNSTVKEFLPLKPRFIGQFPIKSSKTWSIKKFTKQKKMIISSHFQPISYVINTLTQKNNLKWKIK